MLKKNNSGRRGRGNQKKGPKNLEQEVQNLKRHVAQFAPLRNLKYIQNGLNTSIGGLVNAVPVSFALNVVTTGLTENARIGDKAKMNWLKLGFYIYANANLVNTQTWRMAVVQETTALGSLVAFAQMFISATPGVVGQRNYSTRNHKRYITHYDTGPMIIGPQRVSAAGATPQVIYNGSAAGDHPLEVRIPLGFITDYSRGVTGTITDIDTNSLCMLVWTDNVTASAINAQFDYVIEFQDS